MKTRMNTPNRISLARFIGALALFCLFSVVFYVPEPVLIVIPTTHFTIVDLVCFALFIFLAATDGIDGHIARSRHQVTDLGKFLDPLADKILVDGALILLTIRDPMLLPPLFTVLFVARDLCVDGFRMIAASKGVVVPANIYGKAKTVMEMVLVPVLFLRGFPVSYLDRWLDPAAFAAIWTKSPFSFAGETWAMGFCLLLGVATVAMSLVSGAIYVYRGRAFLTGDGKEDE